jgi:hypothetical protein
LYVSDETVRELEEPDPRRETRAVHALIQKLPRLALAPDVFDLAEYYVREGAMPSNDVGDAFHLPLRRGIGYSIC